MYVIYGEFNIELSAGDVYELMRLGVELYPRFYTTVVGSRFMEAILSATETFESTFNCDTAHFSIEDLKIRYEEATGLVSLKWNYKGILPVKPEALATLNHDEIFTTYTNEVCTIYQNKTSRAATNQFLEWETI